MQADASETKRRKRAEMTFAGVDYAPSAETIERIEQLHGDGLPIVSAYLVVQPGPEGRKMLRSETDSLLHQVRPLANDRNREHATRLSLRRDIERIADLVERGSFKAGTLAVFSCSGAGVFEVVGLPRAVRARITVEEIAATRPMLAVLDEYHRCCAVVVDRETADAWELYLGEAVDLGALPSASSRGIGRADERRNDHKEEELEKRHFREVAAALEELFRTRAFEVLVAGGRHDELPRFLEVLSRPLRDRVVGTFAVDQHHNLNAAAGREQAEAILDRYTLEEHRRMVAEVLETAAAGGPSAIGLESCLWAGSVRAVQALYVQEGASSPGVVCDESRWLGLRGDTCPVCGRATRPTADVIEELVEAVIDDGGSIHNVAADAGLAERLVAASLRFELPPAPDAFTGGDLHPLA
jgi:peptide chain release factor subunit 1